ncbi:MAG TPA: PadR family transcriptional regulator [Gemmatimonadaceae bacterium]|nr:PadR family transcriptional regulator [Gemmatimonadaceae bacterium]
MPDTPVPILKGTLDVLVLKTLSWQPMHGFGIACWLEQRSGGVLGIDDSALYQALQRLEERGVLEARWQLSENNRRARYYRLTAAGRKQLRAQTTSWLRYAGAVTQILRASSHAV